MEVYSVSRGPRSMEAFGHMDLDKDKSLTKAEVTMIYKLVIIIKVARTEKQAKEDYLVVITIVGLTRSAATGGK